MLWKIQHMKLFIKLFLPDSPYMCVCVGACPAYTSLSVPVDTKAVLCCPPILLTAVVVATWEITFRDNSSCTRAYRRDNNETKDSNCMDTRITWVSRPDQNPALQIDPVATTHDGHYTCEMVTPNGNFRHGYYLQVLGKQPRVMWSVR